MATVGCIAAGFLRLRAFLGISVAAGVVRNRVGIGVAVRIVRGIGCAVLRLVGGLVVCLVLSHFVHLFSFRNTFLIT